MGGKHARDPELVQADVGDQEVFAPEHLAQLPQRPRRLHREVLVVAGRLEAAQHDLVQPRGAATGAVASTLLGEPTEYEPEVADHVGRGDEVGIDLDRHRVDADDPLVAIRVPLSGDCSTRS